MFFQSSNTEWASIYNGLYDEGNDMLLYPILFDDNDRLLNNFVVQPWALIDLKYKVSPRLNYLSEKYDNYQNLSGFSLGYSDPIRDNRVYLSFVMNIGKQPITRHMIFSLYKAMKDLYLEILPYSVCATAHRNFKNSDTYVKLFSDIKNHYEIFKTLKQDEFEDNKGMSRLV